MKLVSHYLESITGVEIFPLVSFIIFFLFFLGVGWYVFRLDKGYINELSAYPTDDSDTMNSSDSEITN
jgi:cbb3-type cytochrome oxidase subunit 3